MRIFNIIILFTKKIENDFITTGKGTLFNGFIKWAHAVHGPGVISYDIGTKSRFLLMIEHVQALKVFFNVGY